MDMLFLVGEWRFEKKDQNYKICNKSTKNNGKSKKDPNNNWNGSINFKSRGVGIEMITWSFFFCIPLHSFVCFGTWITFWSFYYSLIIDKIHWGVKFYNFWVCFDQIIDIP